jgi:hypothetical protein
MIHSHAFSTVPFLMFVGCAAEAPLAGETTSENELEEAVGNSPEGDSPTAADRPHDGSLGSAELDPTLQAAIEREALAPGYAPKAYPEAPYGYAEGSTVPNFDFLGWSEPATVNFDINQLENIDLAHFYDPDGSKGVELLMVSAVAVWCSVCQVEYAELRDNATYETYQSRGLEMLGVLFEDADAGPARYSDLVTWSRVFEVNFPFVIDPGFKIGAFFDRSATPMNMVVDAKTMEIIVSMTGYNPEIYGLIDRELAARGR